MALIQAWPTDQVIVGAFQNYVPFRPLALLSDRLPLFHSDRNSDPADRLIKAPSDHAQTVRRRLADRVHLSNRSPGFTDALRRPIAGALPVVRQALRPAA